MKRTVIIRIKDSRIYFNESTYLELGMTNLPFSHFQLSGRTIYWELLMKGFDNDGGQLDILVADYASKKIETWESQSPKRIVNRLHFLHIDWAKFENCLAYYDGDLKKLLPHNEAHQNIKPLPKPVTVAHRVSIRNLIIGMGFIKYAKKVQWSPNPVEFTIKHIDMIPQLEYVKQYFAKIIGKKTIDVHVTVWKEDGTMKVGKVLSPDMMKINRESLYVIKGIQIDNFKKKQKSKLHDSMLLTEEKWADVESDFGNVDSIEKEMLFHYLEKEDVRNKLQLQYLSEVINEDVRLMLTIEPQFGFVFTIIGDEMVHFIWELINTHATYVWSFESSNWSKSLVKRLEAEFAIITTHGRSHYRNFFEPRAGMFFHVVNHKDNQDPMVDHFGDWRLHLDKLMV